LISILREPHLSFNSITKAFIQFQLHRTRPINVLFKQFVLSEENAWDRFQGYSYVMGQAVSGIVTTAKTDRDTFGVLVDRGEFDVNTALELLGYGAFDWAITDKEAEKVFKMIASADPVGREKIIRLLESKGYLGRLCENLPWLAIKNLHDSIKDPEARGVLRPYFEGKGGGKSMQKLYEESILSNIRRGNYVTAFGLTFLETAHNALTFGFLKTYSEAYDLREQGLISDDELVAVGLKAAGRSGLVLGATILSGGVAGGFSEGAAAGLGAGETTATLIGGTVGGAAAGVSAQFTADLFNIAAFGQEGLSSAEDYLTAAGIGGASGLIITAMGLGGAKLFPNQAAEMAKTYQTEHPWMTKLYGSSKEAGSNFARSLMRPSIKPPVITPKIQNQMGPRGWTSQQILEAIQSGQQVRAVNKATGNPAIRYVHPRTGQSVVVDTITNEVIHVGGPGFHYGPESGDLP
jgi:hypothetical protein